MPLHFFQFKQKKHSNMYKYFEKNRNTRDEKQFLTDFVRNTTGTPFYVGNQKIGVAEVFKACQDCSDDGALEKNSDKNMLKYIEETIRKKGSAKAKEVFKKILSNAGIDVEFLSAQHREVIDALIQGFQQAGYVNATENAIKSGLKEEQNISPCTTRQIHIFQTSDHSIHVGERVDIHLLPRNKEDLSVKDLNALKERQEKLKADDIKKKTELEKYLKENPNDAKKELELTKLMEQMRKLEENLGGIKTGIELREQYDALSPQERAEIDQEKQIMASFNASRDPKKEFPSLATIYTTYTFSGENPTMQVSEQVIERHPPGDPDRSKRKMLEKMLAKFPDDRNFREKFQDFMRKYFPKFSAAKLGIYPEPKGEEFRRTAKP